MPFLAFKHHNLAFEMPPFSVYEIDPRSSGFLMQKLSIEMVKYKVVATFLEQSRLDPVWELRCNLLYSGSTYILFSQSSHFC